MRQFQNIAKAVREARLNTIYSQSELSHLMGYKNGQFISNIERGVCSVPIKQVRVLADLLNVRPAFIRQAMVQDFDDLIKWHSLEVV